MKRSIEITLILFFILSNWLYSQSSLEAIKRQAIIHMQTGKYGEAIDLLNKYIAKDPQNAEGYNLRGLCHEERKIYQFAVLDFRRATRLDPSNAEIKKNLARALQIWHQLLYKKIEGHEREIAIDPMNPINYLEIGKSYRWLEQWKNAEIWYDKYLALDDDASPDEIIRYTEILAKTGSIIKGEKILKIFVGRYPDDWRLWSRYGYFTLWLGKYRIAENAFLNALSFKPFFKEAEDGLDLTRNKGYLTLYQPRAWEKVYPIDRYYNLLKKNPEDVEIRFKLSENLLEADRLEEAYEILKYLEFDYEGTERYETIYLKIKAAREIKYGGLLEESLIALKMDPLNRTTVKETADYYTRLEKYDEAQEILEEYLELIPDDQAMKIYLAEVIARGGDFEGGASILHALIEDSPNDKELVKKTAHYFADDYDYDNAIIVLNSYLENKPLNSDLDLRYTLAKYYAWNYDWEDARDQAKILIDNDTTNIDYQLLLAQITVWTVDNEGFEDAEENFKDVLEKEPQNIDAIIGLATIRTWQRRLDEAKEYIDLAKQYHPENKEIATIENFYNAQILLEEDRKKLEIRAEGGELVLEGDCEGALEVYNEYFEADDNPPRQAYIEYASIYICLNDYESAINIYDRLLNQNYDYEVALHRARAYLWSGDSLQALTEFKKLTEEDPNSFDAQLGLADSYVLNQEYGKAENLYVDLFDEAEDYEQEEILNQKLDLLPLYGFNAGVNNVFHFILPSNISLIPSFNYYVDNENLTFTNIGGRFELGTLRYFSLGLSYIRTDLHSEDESQFLTNFELLVFFHPMKYFSIGGGFGKLNIQRENDKNVGHFEIRYDNGNDMLFRAGYRDTDARLVLYSPNLIDERLDTYVYDFSAIYTYENLFKFILFYKYLKISDGNQGNDFTFRIGRGFDEYVFVGYEYFFSDYEDRTLLYFSPQNFSTHSIWADWKYSEVDNWKFAAGGKIGYAPSYDFVVWNIYTDARFKIIESLYANGRITFSSSFRYDSAYNFFSFLLSLYWSFY